MVDLTALGLPLADLKQEAERENANRQQQLLQRMGAVDTLTRVYNRDFFDLQFGIQWKIATRKKECLALFLIDVDHFDAFTARHDHRSADYALQKIARTLKLLFRRASDFVARDEADRFIVLAADMTAAQAEEHAARIRDRVQKLKILDAPPRHYLTVSVGCAVCTPSPSDQLEDMVVSAGQALARAQSQNQGKSPS